MASTLSVSKIQGLSSAASPTTVEIANGHKITGAAGALSLPGLILQTVNKTSTTQLSLTSTSFIITDLTVNITPSSSSNKVLVIASLPVYPTANHQIGTIYRDSTNIGGSSWGLGAGTSGIIGMAGGAILDSPNTTSQITYAVYTRTNAGNTSYAMINSAMGTITAMEIAQ